MWQRLERKISFLNCLFVYFVIFFLLSTFLVFFLVTFFVIRIFFPSAFSHPHPPSVGIRSAIYRHPAIAGYIFPKHLHFLKISIIFSLYTSLCKPTSVNLFFCAHGSKFWTRGFETFDPNAVKHWPPVKIRLSPANGRIVSEIIRQKKCK